MLLSQPPLCWKTLASIFSFNDYSFYSISQLLPGATVDHEIFSVIILSGLYIGLKPLRLPLSVGNVRAKAPYPRDPPLSRATSQDLNSNVARSGGLALY